MATEPTIAVLNGACEAHVYFALARAFYYLQGYRAANTLERSGRAIKCIRNTKG